MLVNKSLIYSVAYVEGWRERGRPKKRWIDSVKQDMREMAVSDEMMSDRGKWKEKTCCADPK
jgi:hypothetical protein